jgi:hypothetical protein
VPLDPDDRFVHVFDRLDDTILSTAGDPKMWGHDVDRLVMEAVDDGRGTVDVGKCGSGFKGHFVPTDVAGIPHAAVALTAIGVKISYQRSAEGHVDDLIPSTNPEDWDSLVGGSVQNAEFELIPFWFDSFQIRARR